MALDNIKDALLSSLAESIEGRRQLNALLSTLPEAEQGRILAGINKYTPDTDLIALLQTETQSNGQGRKAIWSVSELLDTDFPEPAWAVPELIPVGLISLAGRPKIGKSWMALQLAVAVASGGYFLGKQVEKAEVLYLAFEDPARRLKSRIKQIGIAHEAPITFKTDYRPLDGDGLNDLYIEVASGRYKLIVVDTFGRSLTAGKLEIKDYADNVAVLSPLQKMAQEYNVTILLVDHHSKINGDNPITDLIGSIGKSATFDSVIGLYKEQGKQGAKMMIVGRDMDDVDLAIEFDALTGCWQSLGDTRSVYQQSVLDAIKSLTKMGDLATTKAVTEYLGSDKGNVSRAISNLVSENKVKKLPKEGVLQPYEAL